MKKIIVLIAALGFALCAGAQDKVTRTVLELGRTDNRTMEHAYFAMNGIPAISFRESDIFGYDFNYRDIWHTEDDLYDHLIPEYMEHSAVVQAVTAYGLANLNHLLSRDGLYKN